MPDAKRTSLLAVVSLVVVGAAACVPATSVTTTNYAYEDGYLYDFYYPADLGYAGMYGASAWDFGVLVDPVSYAGASAAATHRLAVGAALRAAIRGENICPGQVTVTPKTAAPPCLDAGSASARSGITIAFNGCQVTGGGMITGTFDVQSSPTSSTQTCGPTTSISLGFTTTITNLTYTNAQGAKLVIPSQVDTTSMSYPFGQTPTTFTIQSNAELQTFYFGGAMTSDHTSSGTRTITLLPATNSYSIDGTVNVHDKLDGATAVVTGSGVTRTAGCCQPTAGMVTIDRTGGAAPGRNSWTFGPGCGTTTAYGVAASLPACI